LERAAPVVSIIDSIPFFPYHTPQPHTTMGKVKNINKKKQKRHNATGMQTTAEVVADEAMQAVPVETILPLIQKVNPQAHVEFLPWPLPGILAALSSPTHSPRPTTTLPDSCLLQILTNVPGPLLVRATC
jgi:hypothetical protein